MGQKSRDLDNLVSGMDDITLFVIKIIFVVIVISITHALYTWCTKGNKSSKTTRSASSTGAPKATPKASSTASSPQASAPPEPPAYDSIYPDLSKELNAAKKSSGGGGLFSWLFGSGGGDGARDLVFQRIADQFYSVDEVSNAIRQSGLESSNLLFGVDFTKSNLHTGMQTYGGRSLHRIQPGEMNPYQQVISIIGRTLASFDDDGLIPAFGFGDISTQDKRVFPFRQDGICHGFQDVLDCYSRIAANIQMSGPTNFAPVIRQAVEIVKKTQSQYHILIIVADGQVNSERQTREAIVEASQYPLSILMVGVGDGPWDMMKEFDDNLPRRKFDNFQFVDFFRVIAGRENAEAAFALNALMEIPDQYKLIRKLGLLDF
ncbi:E3 ubiquitin-protein ligase RGLG2 isoform X1 [Strongylocentrotus purpuratus]|uniref:VWFA domain-containing protein n=1 Tax=Strongylocentrotus purpuratus TaxID=7668 RepID=A0A7M7NXX7_STRPU|nr:E3 ubiquitin-protein ligase RGLG2 isoform X1 [Strongylocentrotus purpuratus]XP_030843184.1 E3 ubiquitin-protein ligase RGLG2 isoform X1 [Strongylocentrotus purpuratus]